MHLLPILALAQTSCGGSAFDQMLRFIGIAAIVFALFKGIQLLIPKPNAAPSAVAAPPAPRTPPSAPADAIAPEILVVIAAAVASFSSRYRVISIKSQSSHWEMAGRQSVLTSHRIR